MEGSVLRTGLVRRVSVEENYFTGPVGHQDIDFIVSGSQIHDTILIRANNSTKNNFLEILAGKNVYSIFEQR